MFPEMRRKAQQLPDEQARELLKKGSAGVLSLMGPEGYPYGVPLSYLYREGKLYFHSAVQGAKVEALKQGDKASFCVIAADQVDPEKFTTHYASVIAFGRVRALEDPEQIQLAMEGLGKKYSPGYEKEAREEIRQSAGHFLVLKMEIEHLTGKKAK